MAVSAGETQEFLGNAKPVAQFFWIFNIIPSLKNSEEIVFSGQPLPTPLIVNYAMQ